MRRKEPFKFYYDFAACEIIANNLCLKCVRSVIFNKWRIVPRMLEDLVNTAVDGRALNQEYI